MEGQCLLEKHKAADGGGDFVCEVCAEMAHDEQICHKSDQDHELLLCDCCDGAYHMKCLCLETPDIPKVGADDGFHE